MIGVLFSWTFGVAWLVGTICILATDRLFGGSRWHLTTWGAFVLGILFAALVIALGWLVRVLRENDR